MSGVVVVLAEEDDSTADVALPPSLRAVLDDPDAHGSGPIAVMRCRFDASTGLELYTTDKRRDLRSTERREASSWGILASLDAADVVHVVRPATRAGELVVVAAKALHKTLITSHLDAATSRIGLSLGMLNLADRVIVESVEEAGRYRSCPVIVIDQSSGTDKWVALYAGALDGQGVT